MKRTSIFSLLILMGLLLSACQRDGGALAVDRIKAALSAYQAGNGNALELYFTNTLRQMSVNCPGQLQYGCMYLSYQNFATAQNLTAPSPQSFTVSLYDKQTAPNVYMVLVEGEWEGSPAATSCQVFFVALDSASGLINVYDQPRAMTCQQRSQELTYNLFGSVTALPTSAR